MYKLSLLAVGLLGLSLTDKFEAIQGRFYQKKIIVLCAGAFAEMNEDGEKLIKRLAKIAAAGKMTGLLYCRS
jgi:hypothetical protein